MGTLETKQNLTKAAFTDEQADALVEALRQRVTKEDLHLLEEHMNRRLWRAAVTIIGVQIAAMGVFNFLG